MISFVRLFFIVALFPTVLCANDSLFTSRARVLDSGSWNNDVIARELPFFRNYAKVHPNNAEAHLYLGRVYDKSAQALITELPDNDYQNLLDSAIMTYRRARELAPHIRYEPLDFSIEQVIGHAYGSKAMVAMRSGDIAQVRKILKDGHSDGGFPPILVEYCRTMLDGCDSNALLFVWGDDDTFPIWYLQFVERYREDVTVINSSLVNYSWYAQLVQNDTTIEVKTEVEYATVFPRDTIHSFPIAQKAKDRLQRYVEEGSIPDTLYVQFPRGVEDGTELYDTYGMKTIRNILRRNAWVRPVYLHRAPNEFENATPYLRREGMVNQFIPARPADTVLTTMYKLWIDEEKMYRALKNTGLLEALRKDSSVSIVRYYRQEAVNAFADGSGPEDQTHTILMDEISLPQLPPSPALAWHSLTLLDRYVAYDIPGAKLLLKAYLPLVMELNDEQDILNTAHLVSVVMLEHLEGCDAAKKYIAAVKKRLLPDHGINSEWLPVMDQLIEHCK